MTFEELALRLRTFTEEEQLTERDACVRLSSKEQQLARERAIRARAAELGIAVQPLTEANTLREEAKSFPPYADDDIPF